jgi:hypothetical protein
LEFHPHYSDRPGVVVLLQVVEFCFKGFYLIIAVREVSFEVRIFLLGAV